MESLVEGPENSSGPKLTGKQNLPEGKSIGDVKETDRPVYQSIDQSKLVPLLVAAVQEAITKIETLEQDNIALRVRVTNLEGN